MDLNTNDLKKFIPYFGTFFILIGSLNLNIFYNSFNINISQYLEFTEVLVLFFYDAVKLLIVILGTSIVMFLLDTSVEINIVNKQREEIISIDNSWLRLKAFAYHYGAILLFVAFSLLFTIYAYFNNKKAFNGIAPSVFGITILIFFLYILLEFKRKYNIIYGKPINKTFYNLTIFVFIFTLISFQQTFSKIKHVKDSYSTFICFSFQDNMINSNQNFVYVGQTKNYLFMYDKLNSETTIYYRAKISEMNIKQIE